MYLFCFWVFIEFRHRFLFLVDTVYLNHDGFDGINGGMFSNKDVVNCFYVGMYGVLDT